MQQPPFLQPGDTIGVVSTARKIERQALSPAIQIFHEWGLQVKIGQTIGASHHQHAGDDDLRAHDFQTMLDDSSIKAIICARGGNGTVRIVDKVNFSSLHQHPKWIVGFSDVTVLHSHIQRNIGLPTIHGIMPLTFPKDGSENRAIQTLRNALFGETLEYTFPTSDLHRSGTCEAVLTGGNLSTLFSIIDSPSEVDFSNKILFLEEVDEHLYHIDRMLMNLKRSGRLRSLSGLAVGGLTTIKDDDPPYGKTAREIIWDAVAEYNYPVTFQVPAGHIDENCALVLGTAVRLDVQQEESHLQFND